MTNLNEENYDQYITQNGCEYSIFPDDEDGIRIEIDPAFLWGKEDIWELIAELLISSGQLDENRNLIMEELKEKEENQPFVFADGVFKINSCFDAKEAGFFINVSTKNDLTALAAQVDVLANQINNLQANSSEIYNLITAPKIEDHGFPEYTPKFKISQDVKFEYGNVVYKGKISQHPKHTPIGDEYEISSGGGFFKVFEGNLAAL